MQCTCEMDQIRRLLHKRAAHSFDCWVYLLEGKRRNLQRMRGIVLRIQERELSRSWARWCQFVGQMRALQVRTTQLRRVRG